MASTAHQDFKGHHPRIRPHFPHRREEVTKITVTGEEVIYGDAGIGYIETESYGMLQANDAEPPPRNGFIRKVLQVAAVILPFMATAIMATSCHKEPYKEITVDWDWMNAPDTNIVKQYVADPLTKTITLNLLPGTASLGFVPISFNRGYDFLEQNYFALAPDKIVGSGTIFVDESGGAHLPNPQESDIYGMSLFDSLRYTSKGFSIARGRPPANSR